MIYSQGLKFLVMSVLKLWLLELDKGKGEVLNCSTNTTLRVAKLVAYDKIEGKCASEIPLRLCFTPLLFLCSGRIDTAIWMHYMDSNKTAGEEARRQLHKNAASNLEQVLAATPHKTPTVRPPAPYHENYSS